MTLVVPREMSISIILVSGDQVRGFLRLSRSNVKFQLFCFVSNSIHNPPCEKKSLDQVHTVNGRITSTSTMPATTAAAADSEDEDKGPNCSPFMMRESFFC